MGPPAPWISRWHIGVIYEISKETNNIVRGAKKVLFERAKICLIEFVMRGARYEREYIVRKSLRVNHLGGGRKF